MYLYEPIFNYRYVNIETLFHLHLDTKEGSRLQFEIRNLSPLQKDLLPKKKEKKKEMETREKEEEKSLLPLGQNPKNSPHDVREKEKKKKEKKKKRKRERGKGEKE